MSLSDTAVAIKQELTKRTLRGFLLCRQLRGDADDVKENTDEKEQASKPTG
jgi:hypothetical protein